MVIQREVGIALAHGYTRFTDKELLEQSYCRSRLSQERKTKAWSRHRMLLFRLQESSWITSGVHLSPGGKTFSRWVVTTTLWRHGRKTDTETEQCAPKIKSTWLWNKGCKRPGVGASSHLRARMNGFSVLGRELSLIVAANWRTKEVLENSPACERWQSRFTSSPFSHPLATFRYNYIPVAWLNIPFAIYPRLTWLVWQAAQGGKFSREQPREFLYASTFRKQVLAWLESNCCPWERQAPGTPAGTGGCELLHKVLTYFDFLLEEGVNMPLFAWGSGFAYEGTQLEQNSWAQRRIKCNNYATNKPLWAFSLSLIVTSHLHA